MSRSVRIVRHFWCCVGQRPDQLRLPAVRRPRQCNLPGSFSFHDKRLAPPALLAVFRFLAERGHFLPQLSLQLFRAFVLGDRRHHFFKGSDFLLHALRLLKAFFRLQILRRQVRGHVGRITLQMNTVGLVETVWQDVRYAARSMSKTPVFALTVLVVLTFGIGGTTTIFTVVRAVLLKPLNYQSPERVMEIRGSTTTRFDEMRAAQQSFTEVGAYSILVGKITLSGAAEPEVLSTASVSANFLRILGVDPKLGRSFRSEEDTPGGPFVVMISEQLWRRRFGADPQVVGKTIVLGSAPATIIAVLSEEFEFPHAGVDVWRTYPAAGMNSSSPLLNIFGRLKPGVDVEQASSELNVLTRQYALAHPGMLDAKPNSIQRVTPVKDRLVANVRSTLWLLFGAIGFVLLIACANVATLLLARSTSRSREFAVRAAIGAGRGRIVRQLLVESILLALAATAFGVILGHWSLSAIKNAALITLPRFTEIRLDAVVLGFAGLLSIATALLFGVVPCLGVSQLDLAAMLKTSAKDSGFAGSRSGIRWFGTRGLLVMVQVALSIVLLIGATLLLQSMARVHRADWGFNNQNLLTMQISLSPVTYNTDEKKAAFFQESIQRVEAIPGVRSAAMTLTLPMMGWAGRPVQPVEGPQLKLNERPIAVQQVVTANYFKTLQIPLRRGRGFTERDDMSAPRVVIISESFARKFWPEYPKGPDPVGRRILLGLDPRLAEIVGIVADGEGLATAANPGMYLPAAQYPPPAVGLAVRTEGNPMRFANSVRTQILMIDRDQAVSAVQTMDDIIDAGRSQHRLVMTLLGSFAAIAVILALVGMYGTLAYSTSQRTREVGVRVALGAHPRDIFRLLIGQGLIISFIGVAIGLSGAFGLTRLLKTFLFQTSPTEPIVFAGIASLFIVVAFAASYIPVRRATRIDPWGVLRHE